MGPYAALNPHAIWVVVILIMAISAAGYVAVRLLGAGFGLPVSGLASGFISSTATIAAMGARAAKATDVLAAAVAGAVLSTIATVVQMALVLTATSMATLVSLAVPLVCAGVVRQMARDLASKPFKASDNKLPDNLKDLGYDHSCAPAAVPTNTGPVLSDRQGLADQARLRRLCEIHAGRRGPVHPNGDGMEAALR